MKNIEKENLRKKYKLIRDKIENKIEKSKVIAEKIRGLDEYKSAKTIAIYKSFSSEVDNTELISKAFGDKKIIVLPKIEKSDMNFYKITPNSKLIKNKFGIEEPEYNEENLIKKDSIDLAIIPGLCFDKEKNRLGFGKGYYDKYLENSKFITIGICFDEQVLKKELLPINNHDKKMDYIITEKCIF